ncbi:548_t:CDS:1, partial [Dentiscutata heterogama]
IDQDTWIVSRFYTNSNMQYDATEIDINKENSQYDTAELDINEENFQYDATELDNNKNLIDKHDIKQTKTLCVICRSRNFACPCGFYIIRGHDCQDIVAVR